MSLTAARCTQCGAELQVDNSKEAAICEHCGTPFIVEKAINNYNTFVTQNFSGANVTVMGANAESYIERAYIFLEDKNWTDAQEYAQKALDIIPKSAKAYVALYMSQSYVPSINDISNNINPPQSNGNFLKALKYDTDNFAHNILDTWQKSMYDNACLEMNRGTIDGYENTINLMNKIADYKDASEKIEYCNTEIEKIKADIIISNVKKQMKINTISVLNHCISELSAVNNKESRELERQIRNKIRRKIVILSISIFIALLVFILFAYMGANN